MRARRWAMGSLGAAAAVVIAAATAWACVSGPSLNLSTVNAKPGQEVQISGRDFNKVDPVAVRWNALDGPVLGTFETVAATGNAFGRSFDGRITVPADAKAGSYVLIATQTNPEGKMSQMPVRALLTVTPEGGAQPIVGAAPSQTDRQDRLVTSDDSIGGGTLALVALGVAGVGMFIAGMAALFAGRPTSAPEAVRTGS